MTLTVGPVAREEYLAFIDRRPVSYLQCPSWSSVKDRWAAEHLGWRDEAGALAGVGLVLYRELPLTGRWLAVVAEGPAIAWKDHAPRDVLDPLVEHVRRRRAVGLRLGPDLPLHRWRASTLKDAVGAGRHLGNVPADVTDPVADRLMAHLSCAGWTRSPEDDGFYGSTAQSIRIELAGRTPADVLAGMNQQWRRGIRKAEKAGVVVETGGYDDLADFYRVYRDTAERDGFPPQTFAYFQRVWSALADESGERIRLYLGRHGGEVLAAMLVVRVGGLAGYAYGGSATHRREVYPSNAVHWRILQDLLADGAEVYDLRGMGPALDPDDQRFGLVRFKLGTGGDAVRFIGDWDLALRPLLFRATGTALALRHRSQALRAAVRSLEPLVRRRRHTGAPAWSQGAE
jgi:lipid II:glycine glycyltransferase (peptidoglycan interpeptide bridge formation enzyme)